MSAARFDLRPAERAIPRPIERDGGGVGRTAAQNRDAFKALFLARAAAIALSGGTYSVAVLQSGTVPYYNVSGGQQPHIMLPSTLKLLEGRGSVITGASGRGIFASEEYGPDAPLAWSYLAANVVAGDYNVTLETGQGVKWAAGDWVLYRFGSPSFDKPEPLDWGFMRVKSVAGDVVTFDSPFPKPFTIASVTPGDFSATTTGFYTCNKTIVKANEGLRDCVIRDLGIEFDPTTATVDWGLRFNKARNVTVSGCHAKGVGNGFGAYFGENIAYLDCRVEDANASAASLGYAFQFAEVRGALVRNCSGRGTRGFLSIEAGCVALADGCVWTNANDPVTGAAWTLPTAFVCSWYSSLTVRDMTCLGAGGYNLSSVTNGLGYQWDGRIVFTGHLTMIHPTEPKVMRLRQLDCVLDYTIAGTREVWDFENTVIWRREIKLSNGMTGVTYLGERGPIKSARVFIPSGLSLGDGDDKLKNLSIGKGSENGTNYVPLLVAGSEVGLDFYGGTDGSAVWANRAEQSKILITTGAGTAITSGSFTVIVEVEVARSRMSSSTTAAWDSKAWSANADKLNDNGFAVAQ